MVIIRKNHSLGPSPSALHKMGHTLALAACEMPSELKTFTYHYCSALPTSSHTDFLKPHQLSLSLKFPCLHYKECKSTPY